jgi:hypothetical protein
MPLDCPSERVQQALRLGVGTSQVDGGAKIPQGFDDPFVLPIYPGIVKGQLFETD